MSVLTDMRIIGGGVSVTTIEECLADEALDEIGC